MDKNNKSTSSFSIPKYRRIFIKISGEALLNSKNKSNIDNNILDYLAQELLKVTKIGVEIGIIIGGGNFFRGLTDFAKGDKKINRTTYDYMGILSTVINALALKDVLIKNNMKCEIMNAFQISGIVKNYYQTEALNLLENKYILIFSGGTGNPLVSTDSALSLRGIELKADLLLKATHYVDGVYNKDPKKHKKNVKKYFNLSYENAIKQELKIFDLSAFYQCKEYNMQLRIFNIMQKDSILNIALGKSEEGTLITN